MSPHLVPTTHQTYQQAALVLARAFVEEPVSAHIYRMFSPERRIRALQNDFSAELIASLRKGHPVHLEENNRITAAAIIYPPGSYPLPWLDQWVTLLKSVLGNGFYDVRSWLRWLDEADKLHPTAVHYYLPCIGVDPAFQGKGMGSTLMAYLATKADQDGVGCYLENADPRNISFYQRFGFKIMDEKHFLGFPNWYMWREPTSQKG